MHRVHFEHLGTFTISEKSASMQHGKFHLMLWCIWKCAHKLRSWKMHHGAFGYILEKWLLMRAVGAFAHFRIKSPKIKMHQVHFEHLGTFWAFQWSRIGYRWCICAFAHKLGIWKNAPWCIWCICACCANFHDFWKNVPSVGPPIVNVKLWISNSACGILRFFWYLLSSIWL